MRTDKWRYVEWTKPGAPTERELFNIVHDLQNDVNVAAKPEHEKVMESLSRQMRARFPVQEFVSPGENAKRGKRKGA